MLPESYIEKIKEILPDDFEIFLNEYKKTFWSGFRINTLKISSEKYFDLYSDFEEDKIMWCKNGFYYDNKFNLSKTPMYAAGLFYLQEPSAMLPVELLDVKEGMKVLDLCAAPGGKSVQIATKLNNTGLLISNDISLKRTKAILKNIEQQGIKNCIITNATPDELSRKFEMYFDRILLDVPCSGEGMFRKDKDIIKSYEKVILDITNIQKEILNKAKEMLKPGGILVYSTCTFNREENEAIIEQFLKDNPDFEPVDIFNNKNTDSFVKDKKIKSIKLFPHKVRGEGHFAVSLRKKKTEYVLENNFKLENDSIKNNKEFKILEKFLKDFTNLSFNISNIKLEKNSAYLEKIKSENLKPLRIVRNGLYLGDFVRDNFLPSSAFIMSNKKSDFKFTISFNKDDSNLMKYLRCETLYLDERDGLYVVCMDDFPLGLIKVKNNIGKNLYNIHWRIQ